MVTLDKIIREISGLHDSADCRSRMLIENGRTIEESDRKYNEGVCLAYSFCLMRLKELQFQLQDNK